LTVENGSKNAGRNTMAASGRFFRRDAANVEAFVEKGVPWVPVVSLAPPREAIASGAQGKKWDDKQ